MSSVEQALAVGIQYHRAGRLAEAERAYRQVLSVDPAHSQALHQLGMLALQARQFDAAIELIGRAIRGDRLQPAFHANLGEAYRHSGQVAEAIESYRRAVKLDSRLAQAHVMLGILLDEQGKLDEAADSLRQAVRLMPDDARSRTRLGRVLEQQQQYSDAEACYRRVLRTENSPEAHFRLARVLQEQQAFDKAVAAYQTVLAMNPDYAEAHNNLGTIHKEQDRPDEAEAHFQAAIRLKPDLAAAYTNLGALQDRQGRLDEAAASLGRAVQIEPGFALAWHSLGTVLQKQGKTGEALAAFQEALRLDPNHAPSHLSLGYLYQADGKPREALACCLEAIRIDPKAAEAHNNCGVLWSREGRHDEAIACFRRTIELRPGFSMAHSNLAVSLQSLGLLDEAIEAHRRAIEVADGSAAGQHSNLLYCLNYHPGYDPAALFTEHRDWGQRWADPLTAQSLPHTNDRAADRRLRVGYVSPNFRSHAVTFFVEPILAAHDHSPCEVYCYSDVARGDETTRRLRDCADHWRETAKLSDAELADLIRDDQIDILVDLTGHINGGARMLVFARKPAPIQVTYIGYQNTTGMLAMDYRLTDAYADPPGLTDALHTEKLVRLPTTFFCYLPSPNAPDVGALPAAAVGYVTFGSVNAFTKITPQVLETWAELLRRVPRSRLILRADMTESLRARLLQSFAAHGVGPERLELVNRLPRPQYLDLIKRIDIALDPFPFNGHTTTCDCLWQGVPVVTLSGNSYVSRFGGSGLRTLGLDELIAHSRDAYLDIAVALAGDSERLKHFRTSLRARMAESPLLDFERFTRNLEAEYRRMWHDWCAS